MLKIRIKPLVTTLLACTLMGCGTLQKPDPYEGQSAEDIYKTARTHITRGRFVSAVDHLDALEARYPFGVYAEKSQLAIIYAHYRAEEYLAAEAAADRFIELHPRHPHVDYAYYMRGLAHFQESLVGLDRYLPVDRTARDVQSSQQAFFDFATLTERFPLSVYTPNARQRMIHLRNHLAAHTLYAARYYYTQGAYLAAINRATSIIDDFDGTPSVQAALEIMVKSYHKIGLHDLADAAAAIQKQNFPNG